MANYLVTGGAGFIGSHISEALVRRGHRVRVADNFATGYQRNIREGVEFLEGDCADLAFARRCVEGMDYVIHQAAIPSVPRSVDKPLESHRANVDGMLHMLIASRDAGVKRLVFAGSSSVYGDTDVLPKTETMPTNPLSPYALQKLMAEMYGQMFTRLYGFETVTIRYFNVFGPRQDPSSPYSGVISLFVSALLVIAVNFLVDMLYARLDPRARLPSSRAVPGPRGACPRGDGPAALQGVRVRGGHRTADGSPGRGLAGASGRRGSLR